MFLQVVQGGVSDRGGIRAAVDTWIRELAPGATGWLGTTAGMTADDTFVMLNRFDSAQAARRSNNRHEQHDWWMATAKLLIRDVAQHDCALVNTVNDGGSDRAGFVQVIQARVADSARAWAARGAGDESRPVLGTAQMAIVRVVQRVLLQQLDPTLRPDFIGGVVGFDQQDDTLTESVYFTSEAAARRGERLPLPPDAAALWHEWQAILPDARYFDLAEPWLFTPPAARYRRR